MLAAVACGSVRGLRQSLASARSFSTTTEKPLFSRLLVCNRGEIACRVMRTAKRMGISTVAVYSQADADSLHVRMADEAIFVGPAVSAKSYLNMQNILDAIKLSGADAVHPGYGFLSENATFAKMLEDNNITWVGPRSSAISRLGNKLESKALAKAHGVNTVPGHIGVIADIAEAITVANQIGYPVMLKAVSGGGGKGMRIAWNDKECAEGFRLSTSEAQSAFGDARILIEKFVDKPRHIEIQLIGDNHGTVLYFPERECSIQRRNQKVVEEAPSPFLDQATRDAMGRQAVALAKAVGYNSAGTCEFMVDQQRKFYFLEMNTRLQVEHPITEYITGYDLVELMIRSAANQPLPISQSDIKINGWATEARVYAEDPLKNFMPSPGKLVQYQEPDHHNDPGIRLDTGVYEFGEIPTMYDPLIAKLAVHAPTRAESIQKMKNALDSYVVQGVRHNIAILWAVMDHARYQAGDISTNFFKEEYPDGFPGYQFSGRQVVQLAAVSSVAATMRAVRDRAFGLAALPAAASEQWVVQVLGHTFQVTCLQRSPTLHWVTLVDENGAESVISLEHNYMLDAPIFNAKISYNGDKAKATTSITQIFRKSTTDYKLVIAGTEASVVVMTPQQAALAPHMPLVDASRSAKDICSDISGVVISTDVKVGDFITAGTEVAVVEAMKMQNPLRAHRDGKIAKINVTVGSNVSADQVVVVLE